MTWAHPRGCGADCVVTWCHIDFLGHPRGCGADLEQRDIARDDIGSSPRVRGRPQVALDEVGELGLIPAGAGQT